MADEWYYAEGNHQRHGPLPPENIVALYRSERIGLDTLVWREGLAQWQALSNFADELGLSAPAHDASSLLPPPLPPVAPTSPAPASAFPPPKGLSGCAIAALVGAVAGVFVLVVIGILAAIALPAYQEYVMRSRVTAALTGMSAHKAAITEFKARENRCPVNDDDGFGTPESYASSPLSTLEIGHFDNGNCGMEGVLTMPDKAELDSKALWLDYDEDSSSWHCSSEIDDRYLPVQCRG